MKKEDWYAYIIYNIKQGNLWKRFNLRWNSPEFIREMKNNKIRQILGLS